MSLENNELMRAISDKRIRYLTLSKNSLTTEGASFISEFLLENKTLEELLDAGKKIGKYHVASRPFLVIFLVNNV